MKNILSPPNKWYTDQIKMIYLAGSLGENKWQDKVIELLQTKIDDDTYIANPYNTDWTEWKPELLTQEECQTEWEVAHIRIASSIGCILFWMNGNADKKEVYELAEWLTHLKYRKLNNPDRPLKLVLGIENGFTGEKYIRQRLAGDLPDFVIYETLEDTCNAVLEMIKGDNEEENE